MFVMIMWSSYDVCDVYVMCVMIMCTSYDDVQYSRMFGSGKSGTFSETTLMGPTKAIS